MKEETGPGKLPASVIGAGILIAAIWGFNFVVIKVGVSSVPPLFLAALRFTFSALPAVFFVKKPAASLKLLAGYGLLLGVGEFGFLFTAIKLGAPSGLSSIVLQAQAFFTAALAAPILGEKIRKNSIVGMLVAALGLAVFAWASQAHSPGAMSLALLGMVLMAALGWAGANVMARKIPGQSGLGLVAWSSLFSPLPLLALSLLFEGPAAIASAFVKPSILTLGALAYLVILSTLLGYGLWNKLIMRHGAARIAPFSLMVPVFGLASASLVLGEGFTAIDALGVSLILAGLVIHAFGSQLKALFSRRGQA